MQAMPEDKSNFEVCFEALEAGDMPPFLHWLKAGEAARQYFILMALMRKIGPAKPGPKKK